MAPHLPGWGARHGLERREHPRRSSGRRKDRSRRAVRLRRRQSRPVLGPSDLPLAAALARQSVAIGGVSGGAYVLARSGLLDGYRATIHWEHLPAFSEEFPHVSVERNLFVIDRDRLTCAGGIAALDLMHALIERDHGHDLAAAVSEWYLHTEVRSGSVPQRMTLRERFGVSNPKLLKALSEIERRIEEPPGRDELAAVAGTSVRQLERLFAQHLGTTMGVHGLRVRLTRARELLRQTSKPVLDIAVMCGFTSVSHFSRAYRVAFGHPPRAERQILATPVSPVARPK